MKCPYCGYNESKVIDSRPTEEGVSIRRRRECISCKERFTTYEKVEATPLSVIKKDGNGQSFDRDKMIRGMVKSCEKRPVSIGEIEEAANRIENKLQNSLKKEVSSNEIGELVMEELKKLDEVSYVRFASVYREFKDLDSFIGELESIVKDKQK